MTIRTRLLTITGVLSISLIAISSVALADNDPHDKDNFTVGADSCAGCHRAHTALAPNLLTAGPSQDDFCFTCHDGSGAETDVVNGELDGGSYGDLGSGLRGGGFVSAVMDTDSDGNITNDPVTSLHTADGSTPGTIWGSGPINTTETDHGVSVELACGDCHNPHGNGNYRILRGNPDGMENEGTAPPVDVPDQDPVVYQILYNADNYRQVWDELPGGNWTALGYDKDTLLYLVDWCGACHTRYSCTAGSGSTDSSDVVFAFRHWVKGSPTYEDGCIDCHEDKFALQGGPGSGYAHTHAHWNEPLYNSDCGQCHGPYGHREDCNECHGADKPTPGHLEGCLACHVAHGTSSTMGTYSGAVTYPDGTAQAAVPADESRLLWLNNRAVCTVCHGGSNLTND